MAATWKPSVLILKELQFMWATMCGYISIFIAGALCLAGCVESAAPMENLVPVSGTVSFDGKPLSQGTVMFSPKGKVGQPAVGKVVNGKFSMVTTVSAPGVVAGKYKVRIEALDGPPPDPTKLPLTEQKSLISKKYNDLKTSGLEVDAFAGMDDIKWELKP